MLRLLKADLYRLYRGKTLWITSGILVIFYILDGAGKVAANLRANVGGNVYEQTNKVLTGSQAPFSALASPEFLIYFLLPVLIVTACTDFSANAIKNTLSRGVSRARLYLSKLLLSFVICIVYFILEIVLTLVSGTVALGFGQSFDSAYVGKLTEVFLLQLPLFLGIVSIGIFLVFLTHRTAVVNAVYLIMFTAAQLIVTILTVMSSRFDSVGEYELTYCLKQAVTVQSLSAQDVTRIILLGVGYIVIMTLLGIFIFQKSDMK